MLLSHFFVSRSAGWGITDLRIQGGNPTIPFKRISTCEEFENCSPLTSLSCFTVIVSPSFEFFTCPDTWPCLVRLIHWHHVGVCVVKGSWYEGGGHYWRALLWRFHSHWWTHWHHQGACSVVQGATAAASCTFDSSQVTVTKPRSDFLTHIKFSRAATVSAAHSPQF